MNKTNDKKEVQGKPEGRRRGWLGCLGRSLIGLLALLVTMLITGAIYQAIASANDLKKYPPPGELYDVGDYRLHIYCIGEGSPSVILEAGAGSPGLLWGYVQEEIGNSTRVCWYDRAGFGWSDPASDPLSPQQIASDLHTLLDTADVPGPYILVGHSAGGIYVRAYTSQFPSDVVGLVLVDSSVEGQYANYPPEWQEFDKVQNSMMAFCRVTSPFGVMRLSHLFDSATTSMDPEMGAAYLSMLYRTNFCQVSVMEVNALGISYRQSTLPGSLGDLPLIVLTAATSEAEMLAQIPAYLQSVVGPMVIKKVYEANQEMQQDLVSLSSRGRQIMVSSSGHMIQLDQPGVVIDAIREVMERARGE